MIFTTIFASQMSPFFFNFIFYLSLNHLSLDLKTSLLNASINVMHISQINYIDDYNGVWWNIWTQWTHSSVGITTGWTAGVRFPTGARDFSPLHNFQADSGVHPASYQRGCSFRREAVGAWSWPFTSILCPGEEWWSYTSTPPCLHATVLN
jgi:hypothetical protein